MKKLFVLLTLLAIVVSQRAVPGEYIVVLKKNVRRNLIDSVIDLLTAGQTQRVSTRYSTAIRGFTLKGANETEVASLRRDPSVAYVEPNYIMRASALQLTTLYHLDRDDQRRRPLNLQYNYNYNGTGVTAYVVDSGYNTHDEFGNRMRHVYDATEVNGTGHDCYSHGNHVAGIIGGKTYGLAKKIQLRSIKVFNCSGDGPYSGIIDGLEWIANNGKKPAVVNLSMGGPVSQAMDDAVEALIDLGYPCISSAGNLDIPANQSSPASAPRAIVVGASEMNNDKMTDFTNWGVKVDLFAPGRRVTSCDSKGRFSSVAYSGTSQAAPQVSALAAMYLQCNSSLTPEEIKQKIVNDATKNVIPNAAAKESPNRLLYTRNILAVPLAGTEVDISTILTQPEPALDSLYRNWTAYLCPVPG